MKDLLYFPPTYVVLVSAPLTFLTLWALPWDEGTAGAIVGGTVALIFGALGLLLGISIAVRR